MARRVKGCATFEVMGEPPADEMCPHCEYDFAAMCGPSTTPKDAKIATSWFADVWRHL
jgi:hypothetical protein